MSHPSKKAPPPPPTFAPHRSSTERTAVIPNYNQTQNYTTPVPQTQQQAPYQYEQSQYSGYSNQEAYNEQPTSSYNPQQPTYTDPNANFGQNQNTQNDHFVHDLNYIPTLQESQNPYLNTMVGDGNEEPEIDEDLPEFQVIFYFYDFDPKFC